MAGQSPPHPPSQNQESSSGEKARPGSDDRTVVEPTGGRNTEARALRDATRSLGGALRDRYRLIRLLGKGGFGVVYLAHDRILDQDVAIKVLKLSLASENDMQRFIFEARTGAKLRHSAIVNVFDIVRTDEGLQLVMEYYPGGTLGQMIKRYGALAPLVALDYARQVAAALTYAHERQIIHRDIKPANIFLASEDVVKLGDFGICATYESHDYTTTGEIIGTPLYMAPEQTKDSKDVDPRSDLYSLGMTLFHMLTGKPPRVLDFEQIAPDLRPLLKKVTSYERASRPVSAKQLTVMIDQTIEQIEAARARPSTPRAPHGAGARADLAGSDEETVTGNPLQAAAAAQAGPAASRGEKRTALSSVRWPIVVLAAVLMAGLVAVVAMFATRDSKPRPAPANPIVAAQPAMTPAPSASGDGLTAVGLFFQDLSEVPVEALEALPGALASGASSANPGSPDAGSADADSPLTATDIASPETPPPPTGEIPPEGEVVQAAGQPAAEARGAAVRPEPRPLPPAKVEPTSFDAKKEWANYLEGMEGSDEASKALQSYIDWLETPLAFFESIALSDLEKASRGDTKDPIYFLLLWHMHAKGDKTSEAEAHLRAVRERQPDFLENLTKESLRARFDSIEVKPPSEAVLEELLQASSAGAANPAPAPNQ